MNDTITTEKPVKAQSLKAGRRHKVRPTPVVQDRHDVPVVGLDVSEKYLQVCEIDPDGVLTEGRIANSDKKIREYFEGKSPRRIVIEMSSHTRWITELLQSLGHEVLVVDPRRMKLISATLYKDDRLDAHTLAMLAKDAPRLLKTVPLRKVEDQRLLTMIRARAAAVEGRTRIINAIRGMLKPYGYRPPKSSYAAFSTYLWQKVVTEVLRLIEPLMALLETFETQIARFDNEAEKILPQLPLPARQLREIPGVGPLTVLYFVAIIGDPARFAKSRDVGAYLGLCRRRDDSGDYQSELAITKAGDRYMRALLANCASHILGPFGKDSDLRQWGLKKLGGGTRAERRKTKVAVARKLAVVMLTLWKSGKPYDRFHQTKKKVQQQQAA
jgi:transposase